MIDIQEEDPEVLTIVYMKGFAEGRDAARAEIDRLKEMLSVERGMRDAVIEARDAAFRAVALSSEPVALSSEPVALSSESVPPRRANEADIYDFAAWLTCRPGVMEVGSTSDAAPMAGAVGEYIDKNPALFTREG